MNIKKLARKPVVESRKGVINELQPLDDSKAPGLLVLICAKCKKIRDDKGHWEQIEGHIETHSDALFSHGLCPECMDNLYGNEDWYKRK